MVLHHTDILLGMYGAPPCRYAHYLLLLLNWSVTHDVDLLSVMHCTDNTDPRDQCISKIHKCLWHLHSEVQHIIPFSF